MRGMPRSTLIASAATGMSRARPFVVGATVEIDRPRSLRTRDAGPSSSPSSERMMETGSSASASPRSPPVFVPTGGLFRMRRPA